MSNKIMSRALKAICLTRDYVGEHRLPAINGWEWYEAGKDLANALPPDDEWRIEFWKRKQRINKFFSRFLTKIDS